MCGITGLYAFNELGRFFSINIGAATQALARRGPDASDTYADQRVALGHRRLSVIDLAPTANQPLADHTGRWRIVFNGEIFNYRELRQSLAAAGATFRTESDTEVLLELYKREGAACLPQLNGFFAFAVYDTVAETLFLARDRMGVKPLVYLEDEDKFIFASEIKSLLAYGIPKTLDHAALRQYLELAYVPAPHTMLAGVRKLLPGHCLTVRHRTVELIRWYTLPYEPQRMSTLTYPDQQTQLVTLLEAAVQRRLVADVPVGAFLSGGLDSSAIVALAARHAPHLHTFSIGYRDEPFFDETRYANLVAKKFNTNHTVFSLTNDDLYEHLFDALDYCDEPFADSSALAVYILSQRTRRRVTVALAGDGADELFAGYHKHAGEYRVRHGGLAAGAVQALGPLWRALPQSRAGAWPNRVRQLRKFADLAGLTAPERYRRLAAINPTHRLLRAPDGTDEAERRWTDVLADLRHEDPASFNEFLLTDCQLVLPNDMLTKVDWMSMAHGLEVRAPFLDYTVVELAFSLPTASKIDGQRRKKVLYDAFRDVLPPELYHRPKRGFEVPLLGWLRGELRPLLENDLLADDFVASQGVFDVQATRALKQQLYGPNPQDAAAQVWALLAFQHWWKKYFR